MAVMRERAVTFFLFFGHRCSFSWGIRWWGQITTLWVLGGSNYNFLHVDSTGMCDPYFERKLLGESRGRGQITKKWHMTPQMGSYYNFIVWRWFTHHSIGNCTGN